MLISKFLRSLLILIRVVNRKDSLISKKIFLIRNEKKLSKRTINFSYREKRIDLVFLDTKNNS